MSSGRRKTVLSAALLLFVCVFAVGREFSALEVLTPYAGVALLVWAALEWRQMALIARLTFLAALALGGLFVISKGPSPDVLGAAIGRSAFFTFFLVSMDILRTAAMSSRMVLETGRLIVSQPPGRRYTMITLGGHVFAMLLNLGAINLLGAMNRRSIEDAATADGGDEAVRQVRLRRMTLALVRGFTAFTMWAPTAVTVFVVLAAIPDFEWADFAPMGAALVAAYMGFGWLLDRLSYPRRPAPGQPQPLGQVLLTLLPMTLLTLGILATAALLSTVTGVRLIGALLMCVPLFGSIWILVQYSRAGAATALRLGGRRFSRKIVPDLVGLRSEIAILASAGFIAGVLPEQIDTDNLGLFIAGLGLTEGWLLVALMWFVALTAPIGLNPIISVAVSVEILARLSGFSFNPYLLSLGGVVAWGLATGSSPLGATIRISGRSIGRPAAEVGLVWNRPFTIYVLLAASAVQLILN